MSTALCDAFSCRLKKNIQVAIKNPHCNQTSIIENRVISLHMCALIIMFINEDLRIPRESSRLNGQHLDLSSIEIIGTYVANINPGGRSSVGAKSNASEFNGRIWRI